uniref:Phospholipase B-like n=1 Tax=Polytomella parva TaxID=51329 RepID=A0A7S0YIV8_9CHLO|mmetsp:Transcript_29020/g.53327  ORF Transcript_29020/g.53327 Transcript_29020/m.53327 type:complete len:849 (+) Transcript_29020:23-2569(+)
MNILLSFFIVITHLHLAVSFRNLDKNGLFDSINRISSSSNSKSDRTPESFLSHVVWNETTNNYRVVTGLASSIREPAPASGSFTGPLEHISNFGQLRIKTSDFFPDNVQIQAAGFLEGYLTAELIYSHYTNIRLYLENSVKNVAQLTDWLVQNDQWMRLQCIMHRNSLSKFSQINDEATRSRSQFVRSEPADGHAKRGSVSDYIKDHASHLFNRKDFPNPGSQNSRQLEASLKSESMSHESSSLINEDGIDDDNIRQITQAHDNHHSQTHISRNKDKVPRRSKYKAIERLRGSYHIGVDLDPEELDLVDVTAQDPRIAKFYLNQWKEDGPHSNDASLGTRKFQNDVIKGHRNENVLLSQASATKTSSEVTADPDSKASDPLRDDTPREALFWSAVDLSLAQVDGLMAGYSARVSHVQPSDPKIAPLFPSDFLLLFAVGDLDLITQSMNMSEDTAGSGSNWSRLSPDTLRSAVAHSGRCSALVKVTPDLEDILIGHATWGSYGSMLRVYKHYNFSLSSTYRNTRVSFASYPGLTSSTDDWYLLGSGLVVLSTRNDVHNASLLNQIQIQGALSWHRVLAANLLAVSGPDWVLWSASHDAGTSSSQYIVVNLNRFSPGKELQPWLLTISEVIPGYIAWDDVTLDLEKGYWPSYSVPYFSAVYNSSGCAAQLSLQDTRGETYAAAAAGLSYQLSPRAKIFRRDAGLTLDLPSMQRLLRSNGWPVDDFSAASPWDAICARGDLDPLAPDAYGCMDGKVTSFKIAAKGALSAHVINGPPRVVVADQGGIGGKGEREIGGAKRRLSSNGSSSSSSNSTTEDGSFSWKNFGGQISHKGMPSNYSGVDWEVQSLFGW